MNFIADRGGVYWGNTSTEQLLASALPHELANDLAAALTALYMLGYFNGHLAERDGVMIEAKRIITACGQVAWHRSRLPFADRAKRSPAKPVPETTAPKIARGLGDEIAELALEMIQDGKLPDGWAILVQWERGDRPGYAITPIAP